ncbi:MAG TPA: CBS domain-containing protein [Acidimicrobiales bacterium]
MLIEHVLNTKGTAVRTIPPTASVAEATAELGRHNVGALVVSDDGTTIAGIVSERDIVRALAATGSSVLRVPVSDLMTAEVTTCGPRATVDDLMRTMTDHRIRHVPVVDGGAMVGIVSIGDIVKSRIDELQVETDTLHGYLASGGGAVASGHA